MLFRTLAVSLLLSFSTARAFADGQPAEPAPGLPAGVDFPKIDDVRATPLLYADFTLATNSDLSTLPWVKGSGENYRVALGARYTYQDFRVQAELPVQLTRLTIDSMSGMTPVPEDRKKTAASLGDLVLGLSYAHRFELDAVNLDLGALFRARLPTHTTQFSFNALGGGYMSFGFPYYWHFAPAFLAGISRGPVGLVVNQGTLSMYAANATVGGMYFVLPTVHFWEAHYALWLAPLSWLALSAEIETFIQLNKVTAVNFEPLNDVKAVYVTPGLVLRFDDSWWVAVAGRLGVGKGARDFGVISFSGTNSLMVRVGRTL